MGSAAPASAPVRESEAVLKPKEVSASGAAGTAVAQAMQVQPESSTATVEAVPVNEVERVRSGVLRALGDNAQNFLVSLLSNGEWSVIGNELVIKIAESQTVLDMSLSNDAKRVAIAAASGVLGRAVKLKVVAGATVVPQPKRNGGSPIESGPGGRGRAEQDPVVRRMREKFGAEIRTVIDYREKR
jgi:hypothetical protein